MKFPNISNFSNSWLIKGFKIVKKGADVVKNVSKYTKILTITSKHLNALFDEVMPILDPDYQPKSED